MLALALVAMLLYLLLFERGPDYRVGGALHLLDDAKRLRRLADVVGGEPVTFTSLALLRGEDDLYAGQLADIASASKCIHLEAYILAPGPTAQRFLSALAERAAAGVRVRVMIDAVGSLGTRQHHFAPLLAAGGEVVRYHPLTFQTFRRWNNRTHRNLLIVDGRTSWIGGAGIGDQWALADTAGTASRRWHDCVVRVTGSAVATLQSVFVENWLEAAGDLLSDADSFPGSDEDPAGNNGRHAANGIVVGSSPTAGRSTRARILVQLLLASAHTRIDLCTPYFIPDRGIRAELLAARARGVQVRVLTNGRHGDHGIVRRAGRRRYGPLLRADIEISEHAERMLHTKSLTIDGRWTLLGSTNIDHRSFGLNDEVNVLVQDAELAAAVTATLEHELAAAERVLLPRWQQRSWRERLLATLGRIIERHQ